MSAETLWRVPFSLMGIVSSADQDLDAVADWHAVAIVRAPTIEKAKRIVGLAVERRAEGLPDPPELVSWENVKAMTEDVISTRRDGPHRATTPGNATQRNAMNLDAMTRSELLDAQRHLECLARYARTRAEALAYRGLGHIPEAARLERIMEDLYSTLPASMRW